MVRNYGTVWQRCLQLSAVNIFFLVKNSLKNIIIIVLIDNFISDDAQTNLEYVVKISEGFTEYIF